MAPGDIIFWKCQGCTDHGFPRPYAHTAIINGIDSNGIVRFCAHHDAEYNSILTNGFSHTCAVEGHTDKHSGSQISYSVIHIPSSNTQPEIEHRDFGEKLKKRVYFPRSKNNVLYLYMEEHYPNEGEVYADPVINNAYTVGDDWEMVRQADGTYVLFTYFDSNRVLEVENAGTSEGTAVRTGTYTGADHQKWYICNGTSGFMLVPKHAIQMALTIKNSDFSLPTKLCLSAKKGLATQDVIFEDVHYNRINGFNRAGRQTDVVLEVGQRILIPSYASSISDWIKLTQRERNSMLKAIPYASNTFIVQGYSDESILGVSPGVTSVQFTSYYDTRRYYTLNITVVECTEENRSYLPASLTEIEEEAFMHTDFDTLIIPDGCKKIGKNAFFGSDSLRHIYIPASVTEIDPTAFLQHREDFAIYAPAGSAAINLAQENEIIYKILPAQ